MLDIKKINLQNFEELKKQVDSIIRFDLFKEAFFLLLRLEEKVKKDALFQKKEYQDILVKLKWIALPKLKRKEVIKMFASNFGEIFKIEYYDVSTKLRNNLIFNILYEERNSFKKEVQKVLLDNKEIITSKKIIVNQKISKPTVANWLKDYNINVGVNTINKEKQAQYLAYSDNIKKLDNPKEKEKLKILFNLYEKLKLSSLSPEGMEDDLYISEMGGVLSEGIFTKTDNRIKKQIKLMSKIISGEPIDKKEKIEFQQIGGEDKEINDQKIDKTEHARKMPEKISENKTFKPIEIKTLKQEKEVKTSDIFFDKSDDKEISKLKMETDELKNSAGAQAIDLNLEAEQIIEKMNLRLSSFLRGRLKNIIISALKGIRDKISIKEVLLRSTENGGMGMNENDTDKIFQKIKSAKEKIKDKPIVIKKQESRSKNQELEIENKESGIKNNKEGSHDSNEIASSFRSDSTLIHPSQRQGGKVIKDENIKILPKEEKNNNLLLDNNKMKKLTPPPPVLKSEVGSRKSDDKQKEIKKVKKEIIQKERTEKKQGFFGKLFNRGKRAENKKVESQKSISLSNKEDIGGYSNVKSRKHIPKEAEGLKVESQETEKKQGFFGKLFSMGKKEENKKAESQKSVSPTDKGDTGGYLKNESQKSVSPPDKGGTGGYLKKEKKLDYLNDEKPKLVGPIEELENLTIEDFRNWSSDPMKAIEKIKEKIDIAGEKFLEKRVLGIKAWKRSEINMLYLEILNDGLIKHKRIEEIIEEKKKERKAVLSKDEFEAIMELNKRLRF